MSFFIEFATFENLNNGMAITSQKETTRNFSERSHKNENKICIYAILLRISTHPVIDKTEHRNTNKRDNPLRLSTHPVPVIDACAVKARS